MGGPVRLRPMILATCISGAVIGVASANLAGMPAAGAAPVGLAAAGQAPGAASPTVIGEILVHRYFVLLQQHNVPALRAFLSPAFQIQRADGSGATKTAYLDDLPVVESFQLTNFVATEARGVLVVRYLADVTGEVNGQPYTPGPAPRLSVFSWNGSSWRLIAHANFNPLTG